MDIQKRFDQFDGDYLEFEKASVKHSQRPDLNALIILDQIDPGTKDIIIGVGHDEIWLDVDMDVLARATDQQIHDLVCCGVMYCPDDEALYMFC